jgi:hypothetical protein
MPAQPTTAATSSIRRLTAVVTASLVVGLLLPVVLALGPASAGGESRMTGAALLAWGIGWALIAVLSTRFTDVADARRGRQAAEAALLAAEEASGAAEMTAAASRAAAAAARTAYDSATLAETSAAKVASSARSIVLLARGETADADTDVAAAVIAEVDAHSRYPESVKKAADGSID